ncbi:MAG TPA: hypothetical protein VLG48_12415 [Candidatus Methylomirabilis sp.]|nr:hypothetical protein [Candidatus Methylomirabilis sp.]
MARLAALASCSLVMVRGIQDRPPATYSPFFPQVTPRQRALGPGAARWQAPRTKGI